MRIITSVSQNEIENVVKKLNLVIQGQYFNRGELIVYNSEFYMIIIILCICEINTNNII